MVAEPKEPKIVPCASSTTVSARRAALAALTLAGVAWGLTVPLSAVALHWLGPAWLVALRFGLGALVLGLAARGRLRAAVRPATLVWGMLGYGAMVLLQNDAIHLTDVSHVALLTGTVPGLVALLAIIHRRRLPAAPIVLGLAGAVGGVALTAGARPRDARRRWAAAALEPPGGGLGHRPAIAAGRNQPGRGHGRPNGWGGALGPAAGGP